MPPRALTDAERQLKASMHVDSWLRSRKFARVEDEYYAALDDAAKAITARAEDGQLDPQILKRICAALVSGDGYTKNWFATQLHRTQQLRTEKGWQTLCRVVGGAIVERYLRLDRDITVSASAVVTQEELVDEVMACLAIIQERAQRIEGIASAAGEAILRGVDLQEITDSMQSEITALLADEVLVALPTQGALDIPRRERETEISKRALLNLRLGDLKQIARERGLPVSGRIEKVAERIARDVGIDRTEIARTIIMHEKPRPERGIITRLIPLDGPPSLSDVEASVSPYVGRFVRIGVARWLVISEVLADNDRLDLNAHLRYYHVEPKVEDETYTLLDQPRRSDLRLRLRPGSRWVEVTVKKSSDAGGVENALRTVARLSPYGALTIVGNPPPGEMVGWDIRTVFMLNFLSHHLPDNNHHVANMMMASFESDVAEERAVSVTSVRLHGQQLISSRSACELVVAGRGLLSAALLLRVQLNRDEDSFFNIRIDVGEKSATVSTALTGQPENIINSVHSTVISRLRRALDSGIAAADFPGLVALSEKIRERAAERGDPDEADILVEQREPETVE
jgi:hypothetical protein